MNFNNLNTQTSDQIADQNDTSSQQKKLLLQQYSNISQNRTLPNSFFETSNAPAPSSYYDPHLTSPHQQNAYQAQPMLYPQQYYSRYQYQQPGPQDFANYNLPQIAPQNHQILQQQQIPPYQQIPYPPPQITSYSLRDSSNSGTNNPNNLPYLNQTPVSNIQYKPKNRLPGFSKILSPSSKMSKSKTLPDNPQVLALLENHILMSPGSPYSKETSSSHEDSVSRNASYNSRENSSKNPKNKRLKLSYTCTECRRRRTKCDKKNPCSACKSKEFECKYDITQQKQPKKLNKDAYITRLSRQLNFYKELAFKYSPPDEISFFPDEIKNTNDPIMLKNGDAESRNNQNLILKFKKNSSDKDLYIFSDLYVFKNESFINMFFFDNKEIDVITKRNPSFIEPQTGTRHIASQKESPDKASKSLQPSLRDLKKMVKDFIFNGRFDSDFQKMQGEKFIKRICETNSKNSSKDCYLIFTQMYSSFQFEGVKENTIEDVLYTDSQSPLLSKILGLVNDCLPSMARIKTLKSFYYLKNYTALPCFDLDVFESFCDSFLKSEFEGGIEKAKIVPKGKNIRNKMANVALLLLILKSSDMVYKSHQSSNKESQENTQTSTKFDEMEVSEFLTLAINILMTTNPLSQPSVHKISAFCQIWVDLGFLPDSRFSSDLVSGQPTDFLASFILNMSFVCGIFPLKNGQIDSFIKRNTKDTRALNHCKKISFFITQMIYAERLLKGSVFALLHFKSDLKEEDFFKLMADYKEKTAYDGYVAGLSLKRALFFKLTVDCYSLCDGAFVNVAFLEEKMAVLTNFFLNHYDISKWKTPTDADVIKVSKEHGDNIHTGFFNNIISFENNCFYKVNLLKIYHVLILALESSLVKERSAVNEKLLLKYCTLSYSSAVESALMLHKYSNKEYELYLGKTESLTAGRVLNLAYCRTIIILLQFVSKFFVYKVYLQKCIYNDEVDSQKIKEEYSTLKVILNKTSQLLFQASRLYSREYRFVYFQSFKMCLFLDFFKHLYEDNRLYSHMFDTVHVYEEDKPLPNDVASNQKLFSILPLATDFSLMFSNIVHILSTKDVDDFLSTPEIDQKNSSPIYSSHTKDQKSSENIGNTNFDTFDYEEYLRDFNIADFPLFQSDFLF